MEGKRKGGKRNALVALWIDKRNTKKGCLFKEIISPEAQIYDAWNKVISNEEIQCRCITIILQFLRLALSLWSLTEHLSKWTCDHGN